MLVQSSVPHTRDRLVKKTKPYYQETRFNMDRLTKANREFLMHSLSATQAGGLQCKGHLAEEPDMN